MTPLSVNTSRYSDRRNSEGLLNFIPEPEKVYRRRLNKLASCRILEELGSESVSDIHVLFRENFENSKNNNCFLTTMNEYFTQLDFSQIAGQPHEVPEKAIDKLVTFTGTDASTSAKQHLRYFSKHCHPYARGTDKH